jgi:hypothetical protein
VLGGDEPVLHTASVNSKLLQCATKTMVRQAMNCDIHGLEPPASDSSGCMRLMTVTAATCSRSLLHVTFACAQLGRAAQSPLALWIDFTGVAIRVIAGMLIAIHARNNVPHFAWLRVCNTVGSSAISQLSDMVARLSRRSIDEQLVRL